MTWSFCKNIKKGTPIYSVHKWNKRILISHSVIWRSSKLTSIFFDILHEIFAEYFNYFQFTQFALNTISMPAVLSVQINPFSFTANYHRRSHLSEAQLSPILKHTWFMLQLIKRHYLSQLPIWQFSVIILRETRGWFWKIQTDFSSFTLKDDSLLRVIWPKMAWSEPSSSASVIYQSSISNFHRQSGHRIWPHIICF